MEFLKLLLSLMIIFMQAEGVYSKKGKDEDKKVVSSYKDVVVVGGGLAGMAAARRLHQDDSINVRVLEARKDRYGGRVWTKRGKVRGVRGVDRELGGVLLNTKAYNGALGKLLSELEIEVKSPGSVQVHFPDREDGNKVLPGDKAQDLYTELFKVIVSAVRAVKTSKQDRPLAEVLAEAVNLYEPDSDKQEFDKDMLKGLLNTLPTPLCQNLSTLLYDVQSEFGWDGLVVDGFDSVVDRLVAGEGMEPPLKVDLTKVVRNIKIDDNRQKVLVRTTDMKQLVVDAVILAVPIGVLKSKSIIIEPKMPNEWFHAINDIGVGYSSKIIVGFEKAFWPKEPGAFTVSSEIATDGFLQMWNNAYKFSGNPYLIGNIFGDKAKEWESGKKSELKKKVIDVLGQMFGVENVKVNNITVFLTSSWSTDEFTLGSVSYPQVGNTEKLWETLRKPACPYLYFAGAHLDSMGHVDTLHGAYNSGIRAADQILSHFCEKQQEKDKLKQKKAKENKAKEGKTEKNKTNDKKPSSEKKDKQKKDEL